MTSANGTPVGSPRLPSAAFPRGARGALPPGQGARAVRTARRRRPAWMAVLLAAPLRLPRGRPRPAATAAPPGERGATALAAVRPPRLPDAPQELLPAAEAQ